MGRRQPDTADPSRASTPASPSELTSPVTAVRGGYASGLPAAPSISSWDSDSVWNFSSTTTEDTWERASTVLSGAAQVRGATPSRLGPRSVMSATPDPNREFASQLAPPPSTLSAVGGRGSVSMVGSQVQSLGPDSAPARRSRAQIRQIQRSTRRSGGVPDT